MSGPRRAPRSFCLALALVATAASARSAHAQSSPTTSPTSGTSAATSALPADSEATVAPPSGPSFDVDSATRSYLAMVPAAQKARSDSYFEGGYWIRLWSTVLSALIAWLLLRRRWSAAMRDRAGRMSRRRPLRTFLYWVQYTLLTTALELPFAIYWGFVREHQYGLSTQTFGGWAADQLKALVVAVAFGGALVVVLYAVLRRAGAAWWLWGSGVALAFLVFFILVFPVFIAPLFNRYAKLSDERVRQPILSLARANGIDATDVYEFDASRQSTRISANVSGLWGTERISLNDNLLRRANLPEIESVMAHEMGHYVLNHVYESIMFFAIVVVIGFALLRAVYERVRRRWGEAWGIGGIEDEAGLPLALLIITLYLFAISPATNSFVRTNEYEADVFGLNAARQPDGFARVALKLAEYRKLDPGPLEELLLFDHPSGRTRIRTAMRWKAEHPR